jgi:hypothetical protein
LVLRSEQLTRTLKRFPVHVPCLRNC